MGWNLHEANLPRQAKDYLSVLGSCGDADKAAREVRATAADVHLWQREPEFLEHRRHAMEYFDSWREWHPARPVDPTQWPSAGRLDLRFEPFRVPNRGDES